MGRLVYVVGASGAGKDSVMTYARARLAEAPVAFAHRYITRPADAGGDNHVALGLEEFRQRKAAGCFLLDWESHGRCYGIGREIGLWMDAGLVVVANGSRAYLGEARRRIPGLLAVEIRADEAVLAERLARRGRETVADIGARLERTRQLPHDDADLAVIDNSGPLPIAGDALLALIQATRRSASQAA